MASDTTRTRRPLVVMAIILATFMNAIEATIVATAMPRIVGELGDFTHYSWVFSAYLLAQTTTNVIYGKLADIFGRKPVLIFGILIFLLGSLLSGFATSMSWLIGFRLLQGLGAGAIQPITMTVVGDLYTLEERPRVQGLLAGVWAMSAVIGPQAGALIIQNLPWAWLFWVNIPIGLVAMAGFMLFLHETVAHQKRRIDYLGAVFFSLAAVSLLIILTEAGASWLALSGLCLLCAASTGLFLWQEGRAPEPMVSLALWSRPLIASCNVATLLAGTALIGLTLVLPLYVQGVLGRSPLVAGFTLTMLMLGWPLAVTLSGRFFRAFGVRNTLRYGGITFPVGGALLVLLTPQSDPSVAGIASFLMGIGMGLSSITCMVLIQESVEWSMRGSATASNIFARSLGTTLGATVLGAILNFGIAHLGSGDTTLRLHAMLERPSGLAEIAADPDARGVLAGALHMSYLAVLALALLAFATSWLIPIAQGAGRPAPAE
jgi:EmrB/QacA subfamily drug resistance transporter